MNEFIQDGPTLSNTYLQDSFLQDYVKKTFPGEILNEIEKELTRFGERMATDVLQMANRAESNPPKLVQFDAWGKRIDHIEADPAWYELDRVAAEEGIIATGYERKYSEYSRVLQFVKLYLFHSSSSYYSCPLAMTDGAAKLIELSDDLKLKSKAFKHLTSRDPDLFWTSGQWMTERAGGSDVGRSETIARLEDGEWRLYGTKWFTSATTSQMAMTLARIEENGETKSGSRGLSLFYLELRDENQNLNGIEILRLKDKLGTKALPTAELKLVGAKAKLVGNPGEGVKTISSLFNVTRIYNACCASSAMRRIQMLAKDYAFKREAFGKKLIDHPLHVHTLAACEVEIQACAVLTFYVAELLGKEEVNKASKEESQLLRLLTPIAKLYTAKKNIEVTSELIESFGGAGYVEDTGLPRWLRDAQVLAIWEGTTNVLSLDVLRALTKECPFETFHQIITDLIDGCSDEKEKAQLTDSLNSLQKHFVVCAQKGGEYTEAEARNLAFSIGNIFIAALLLDGEKTQVLAKRFMKKDLILSDCPDEEYRQESQFLLGL